MLQIFGTSSVKVVCDDVFVDVEAKFRFIIIIVVAAVVCNVEQGKMCFDLLIEVGVSISSCSKNRKQQLCRYIVFCTHFLLRSSNYGFVKFLVKLTG